MSEEETTVQAPKIEPLTEEEITKLTQDIEDNKDFESDLSRALFTILVVGFEYQQLYTTLQAYYAASAQACHDLAGACAREIGIRDMKKMQKLAKLAGQYAGQIPNRAADLLSADAVEETTTTEEETTNEANPE